MKIHVLFNGQPLCRFNLEDPITWPGDHTWVRYEDWDDVDIESKCANCDPVVQPLAALHAAQRALRNAFVYLRGTQYAVSHVAIAFMRAGWNKPVDARTLDAYAARLRAEQHAVDSAIATELAQLAVRYPLRPGVDNGPRSGEFRTGADGMVEVRLRQGDTIVVDYDRTALRVPTEKLASRVIAEWVVLGRLPG